VAKSEAARQQIVQPVFAETFTDCMEQLQEGLRGKRGGHGWLSDAARTPPLRSSSSASRRLVYR